MCVRHKWILKAKLAYYAKRYKDMVQAVKEFIKIDTKLNNKELSLVYRAYKCVTDELRRSRVVVMAIEESERADAALEREEIAEAFRSCIEFEIRSYCQELINIINQQLVAMKNTIERSFLCYKMKGDYYYILLHIEKGKTRQKFLIETEMAYSTALILSKDIPIFNEDLYLFILNYTIFKFYELQEHKLAIRMAEVGIKNAFRSLSELNIFGDHCISRVANKLLKNVNAWKIYINKWNQQKALAMAYNNESIKMESSSE